MPQQCESNIRGFCDGTDIRAVRPRSFHSTVMVDKVPGFDAPIENWCQGCRCARELTFQLVDQIEETD